MPVGTSLTKRQLPLSTMLPAAERPWSSGTGQARPTNHVTGTVDVRHARAVVLVDFDLAAAVDLHADVFQAQGVGVAGTTVAPEQGIGLDLLAGLEVQDHAIVDAFDAVVVFVVAHGDVVVAEVIAQGLGDFRVQEAQQLAAVIHQLHQHTQAAEDRGVFATDHASAVDDELTRGVTQAQDGVAIVDTCMVEIDVGRAIRARTGGDDDVLGHQLLDHAIAADHFNRLLIGKAAGAEEHINAITRVVAGARGHLLGDHLLGALEHVREGEPARLADGPEHRVGVELHDLPDRVTQGLGRDGTQVGAVAADLPTAVDHRHLAPCLGRVHCRAFPAGPEPSTTTS